MTFSSDLDRFAKAYQKRMHDVFIGVTEEVHRSVVFGSEITGAPGQPVGQYGPGYHPGKRGGTLRDSWTPRFLTPEKWELSTNVIYARPIEDGVGRYGALRLRSTVGGFHSVAKTVGGFGKIADTVTREVIG